MYVTGIQEYIKNNKKSIITLDNIYKLLLFKRELKLFNIYIDREIDADQLQEILTRLYKRGLSYSLNLINRRFYTQKEIINLLRKALYPDTVIRKIITDLIEQGFINDERLIKALVAEYSRKLGAYKVKEKLLKRGFNRELIEKYLSLQMEEIYSEDKDMDSIIHFIEKKAKSLIIPENNLEKSQNNKKIIAYLMSRGYPYERIKLALDKYYGQ